MSYTKWTQQVVFIDAYRHIHAITIKMSGELERERNWEGDGEI